MAHQAHAAAPPPRSESWGGLGVTPNNASDSRTNGLYQIPDPIFDPNPSPFRTSVTAIVRCIFRPISVVYTMHL